jgi:hypothetical protein
LGAINVDAGNVNYASEIGVVFNKSKTTLIIYPRGKIGSYTIPESVITIGNYAFYYCSGLTSVTIGNSVETIGEYAFRNCTGLTSVTIPNLVETIGDRAFYNCTGLTSVTIGNSVETIGNEAFYYCTSLTTVINQRTTPQAISSNTFHANTLRGTLKVPASAVDAYENANVWKGFSNTVSIE